MRSIVLIAFVACLAGACSGSSGGPGDDDGPLMPKVIAGGGVANPGIAGTLYVHVVEVDTATPIANASVIVGSTTVTTDAQGLATVTNVTGPQTVTASASNHVAATWIGVAGANVTVPLSPTGTVPVAHVSGTIAGWDQLPGPNFGHYNLAVVLYSFLEDPSAPENSIAQPMQGSTPLFTCINSGGIGQPPPCNWQINARVGKQIHTAVILDGDAHGSQDPADDTYDLIGYAAGDIVTLTANQQMTNEVLQMTGTPQSMQVSFSQAPPGLGNVVAIPELSVPEVGRIVFPLPPLSPKSTTTQVMAPTGKFAGTYHVVGLATPNATAKTPFSTAFADNVTNSATLGSWIAPPTGLSGGATLAFTASTGAAFHTAQLLKNNTPVWNITILEATPSFTLPTLTPDPIGTGTVTFSVAAADVPSFDPTHFDVPATKTGLARAAGAQTTFSR